MASRSISSRCVALVVDRAARNDLEAFDEGLGLLAAMGLDDADDHVDAFGLAGPAGHQHFVGLADAGGRAEENLQPAARPPARRFQAARPGTAPVGFIGHAWTQVRIRHTEAAAASPAATGLDAGSIARASSAQVERQNIDPRLAREAEQARLGMLVDKRAKLVLRHPASLGDARHLEQGRLGRDVRIEPAARSWSPCRSAPARRVLRLQRLDIGP